MSSVPDDLRRFICERLTAAAEEIFGVFHKTIVQYEEELDRQRKLLDVVLKPEIKLCRIELPQHDASKEEEVLVEQQQLWNQETNSSVDPEPPQIKEEQEEVCRSQLCVKQENQDLMLISKYEENDQREDQTGPSEESPVKFPFIVSVVSEANSELQQQQQMSNKLDGAESQDQNEGKHEDLEPKELNNKYCQSFTNDVNNKTMLKKDSVSGKKSFPCDTCGKDFRRRANLQKHMKTHTGERPYTCDTCGKSFSVSYSLILHLRVHTGERPYVCKTCGKSYTKNSTLTRHCRIHSKEKAYLCKTCGKTLSDSSSLMAHQRQHTGERPYVCKTCSKAFANKCDWRRHLRKHTGEKPYLCQTCGKAFSVSSGLMRHQRLHADERPFICKTCSQTFKFNAELVVHMRRAHTGERPYVCKTCGKDFFTSSNLSVHRRRTHTDANLQLCKKCGTGFILTSDLAAHMRRIHKDDQ